MRVNIDLTRLRDAINPSFYPLLTCRSRFLVLKGGGGSGKSHFVVQKHLIRILLALHKGYRHRFVFYRKTQRELRDSVFDLIQYYLNLWNVAPAVDVNRTRMEFSFPGGSQILCRGLDDKAKLKSSEGITSAVMEEAFEFTKSELKWVDMYTRGKPPPGSYQQITLMFNPEDESHFLNDMFFLNQREDTTVHESTFRDNRFLPERNKKVLQDLEHENPELYRIFGLGLWGVLTTVIYTRYKVLEDHHWPKTYDERIYGLDFGYNNPTALIEIRFVDQVPYCRELLYETKLTNSDRIKRIRKIGINRTDVIYADSEDPGSIEEIYDEGYNIKGCTKFPGSVKAGIDYVKSLELVIHGKAANVKREFRRYSWKVDKEERVLDEPVKMDDHACDAIRYALHSHKLAADPGFKVVK